jgi:hypothetical protein
MVNRLESEAACKGMTSVLHVTVAPGLFRRRLIEPSLPPMPYRDFRKRVYVQLLRRPSFLEAKIGEREIKCAGQQAMHKFARSGASKLERALEGTEKLGGAKTSFSSFKDPRVNLIPTINENVYERHDIQLLQDHDGIRR